MKACLVHYTMILVLLIQSAVSYPTDKKSRPFLPAKRSTSHLQTQDTLSSPNQATNLYRALELSLLNDSNVLFELQDVFFPPNSHLHVARIPFSVNIIVESVTHPNSIPPSQTPFNCSYGNSGCYWSNILIDWYPEVTAGEYSDDLRQYVLSIHSKLRELEYVSWQVLQLLAEFGRSEDHQMVSFTLRVSRLEVLPRREDAEKAILSLMSWLKAYARASFNQPVQRSDEDKSDVFFAGKDSDHLLELCVLLLFLSLNLFITVMAGVFLKSISSFLVRKATGLLKERTKMLSLYWGTGLVCTAANLACLGADIYFFQVTLTENSDHKILYAKFFLIVFILFTEPFIVYYTTRHFGAILNVPPRVVHALCCCFSNVYGSRFAHTLAVLNILWFVHRTVTTLILVLFHIVVSPAETFTTLTLMLSVFIIMVFLTAYVLHTCSTPRVKVTFRTVCKVFCALVTGTLAVAVVVSFALVYLMLLDNGLQTSGVGGFLLSLFPPFIFFMIGLIVQRKFLRKKKQDSSDEEEEIVSSGTGNVTKMAEYQQLVANSDGGRVGQSKTTRGRSLSVQFSVNSDREETDKKRKPPDQDETSSLITQSE